MAFISKIRAGQFNQRIKIKSLVSVYDDFGGTEVSYSDYTTVWANKNVKSLRDVEEKFEGDELTSYGRFVFTIRYSSRTKHIKSNWILQETTSNTEYNIIGCIIDPRKEFIEIFVKEDLATQDQV